MDLREQERAVVLSKNAPQKSDRLPPASRCQASEAYTFWRLCARRSSGTVRPCGGSSRGRRCGRRSSGTGRPCSGGDRWRRCVIRFLVRSRGEGALLLILLIECLAHAHTQALASPRLWRLWRMCIHVYLSQVKASSKFHVRLKLGCSARAHMYI